MDAESKALLPSSSSEGDGHANKRLRLMEGLSFEADAEKPTQVPSKKLCFISSCVSPDPYDNYNIFIVDLKDPGPDINAVVEFGFVRRDPTFRINWESFPVAAFCVLDSKLYIFEGYDDQFNPHGKSVFTFDLSAPHVLTTFNLKLEKSALDKASPMLCAKNFPVAVPTSDGKILVFSSLIQFGKYDKQIDFELYDPRSDSWRELPRLSDLWRNIDRTIDFWIEGYSIKRKSILFLKTEVGMFTLDLESPECWKPKDMWAGAGSIHFGGGPFFVIGNEELCFTAGGVYDLTKEEGFSGFFDPVESSFDDYRVVPVGRAITCVDDGDGGCNFCIAQAGLHKKTKLPYLIIDVLCCDPVIKCSSEDKKELMEIAFLETSIIKSFKLFRDAQSQIFSPVCFFAF